jgi:hypothetical protein
MQDKLNILGLVKELRSSGYNPELRERYLDRYRVASTPPALGLVRDTKVLAQGLDAPVIEHYFADTTRGVFQRRQKPGELTPEDPDWTFYTTGRDAVYAAVSLIDKYFIKRNADSPNMESYLQGYDSLNLPESLDRRHIAALNNAANFMTALYELGPAVYEVGKKKLAQPESRPEHEGVTELMEHSSPLVMTFAMKIHREDFIRFISTMTVRGFSPKGLYEFDPHFFRINDNNLKKGLECISPLAKEYIDCTHSHSTPLIGCPAGYTGVIAQMLDLFNHDAKFIYPRWLGSDSAEI